MTETAPLTQFKIIGVRENWYSPVPEVKQPGGSCWHCGTGIAIEVVIQSTIDTDEVHTIGTTCAERVGLDKKELKRFLAEKYATERYERSAAVQRARKAEREAREAAETELFGPHGTVTRYESGCFCNACVAAAPHGTFHRFIFGNCQCLKCIDNILTERPDEFWIRSCDVIVRLGTGEIVPARKVDTKYGYRWCVNDGAAWLPISPARRDTHAKKGYVQAEAPFLMERHGRGIKQWSEQIVRLGDPIVDAWGERIEHKGNTA